MRELKSEFPNYYFYIAGDFNATIGDEETLFGWANNPSRPRFGRVKSTHNGVQLLQFCRENELCIMNRAKKSRQGDKETWAHPKTEAKSCKDYMLTFRRERAQIRFVRATGHWNERWFTDHRPLSWRLDTSQSAFRQIKPKSLRPEARAIQTQLTPPINDPAPSTPNPTPRKPSLPGSQALKRKREPPCFGRNKREKLVCAVKICKGWKELPATTSLKTAEEIISAAKKLQDAIAISSSPAVTYPSTSVCRAAAFDTWAAANPQLRDPKVPASIKRALASNEAKRLNRQRNRAMLKSIVLYTQEVGITDLEAIKRLKDFLRTLKPVDTSCEQVRPTDEEFADHLGQLFCRDEGSLHAKFRIKHLKRFGPKFPVVWQVNRPLTLKEVKRGIRESSTGTAPGLSGLMNETIKLSDDAFAQAALKIFDSYWCVAHARDSGCAGVSIPEILLAAKVFLIPKPGDLSDPKNWRSIFTLETLGKVLARCVVNRIEPLAKRVVSENQFGFQRQMSTTQAIVALTLIQQKANEQSTELWGLFIDIEKAFDSPS